MKNMLKVEKFRLLHSYSLWIIIGVLFAFCCISIMTGVYRSAEDALLNISKDIVVPLLGCAVYCAIVLLDDFSSGLIQRYISSGYKRASIILAKYIHYVLGCSILLFIYPLLCITFTALVRSVETSFALVVQHFILIFVKSLPLYWGILSLFFLFCILFQKTAIAMAISVAASIFLAVFPNRLYSSNFDILKYSQMIQLNEVATTPISGEYLIAVAISILFLSVCLCGSVVKFEHDEY